MQRKYSPDYTRLDQKLFEIAGIVENNLLKFINPQNMPEQKTKFFESLAKEEEYNPEFTYTQKNANYSYFASNTQLESFREELTGILEELGKDELGIIFESEAIDLLEKLEMIKSIGTENFSSNTESYYGGISKAIYKKAIQAINTNQKEPEQPISFETAIKEINEFLRKNRLKYSITIREPSGARFAVVNSRREILINKDTEFTKQMLKRLIAHEIETHIYRYENGLRQPYKILAHGFSRETTETEEGLAVCVEKMSGVSSQAQIKEYAGRVAAIYTAQNKNFFETFNEMNKYFDEEQAFRLALRAKRGIKNQTGPGAFFKDALYFKGMIKVEEFLQGREAKELFYGKYSIDDIPLVRSIPGLKEPKYLPNALREKITLNRKNSS